MRYMTKKKITDIQPVPLAPIPTAENAIHDILAFIRQLQPEFQNEVVSKILEELAKDRYLSAKSMREESDRASKNLETFMTNAIGLEKILAEKKAFQ